MKKLPDLLILLEYYSLIQRKEYCNGCQRLNFSQKYHQICMTSDNQEFYNKQGLQFMIIHNIISQQEYLQIKSWIKQNGPSNA